MPSTKLNQSLENTSLSKETTLHLASIDDFEELIDFVLSLPYVEQGQKYNVSLQAVIENLARSLTQHPGFVLKNESNEIVGCSINAAFAHWWEGKDIVINILTYVEPYYRTSENFDKLLDALEEYGKINYMPVMFGLVHTDRTDVKERLLERKGYTRTGVLLEKSFPPTS